MKADRDSAVTVLLSEQLVTFDAQGREIKTYHTIYRVENEAGVQGWAESSGEWEPWRQARPDIRARVIASDGSVHNLDPKTLNDVPVQQEDEQVYSDRRNYGGPLPGIAVGAIVEEEVVIRDTAAFFAGGSVHRVGLARRVPVHHSRIVLSHPESLLLHYQLKLLPDATVGKSNSNGVETITIENGLLPPYPQGLNHLPADVAPYGEVEFGTGTSWQQVAVEYARLSNDKIRLSDVQALMAKINTREGSRAEIIARIVSTLHRSVRYTGVEFDEASLVPQFPAETLKRKYGDCKDKATLLAAMLRAAGIPANLALLDTGPGQDINVELAGMGMFDHAIVYVPGSGVDAELWIDATDRYARPGDLPFMDYGRWALVVDEKTTALRKTPELTAAQNFHREIREFSLAEFGPADIIEKNEQTGPRESEYREFYSRDPKQVRESSEGYVKRAYLADALSKMSHSDLEDTTAPLSFTFFTKGKRGSTGYESATMAIRIEDLFYGLPDYFTSIKENEDHEDADNEHVEKPQPRTVDWEIYPFINEWDYRITAPPGFKVRALPSAKESQLGTAKLSQTYSVNADGTVVEATLRFESGRSRLTVAEAKALRDAVVRMEQSDPILIGFDQVGHSLMMAGKITEGLAAYHQLVLLHPKEALHRIQLARALLDAGMAEKARSIAKEATVLEPKSSQAYNTLGWILQHDLIGRHLKKGFDYQGAIAAYRRAKELDLKDKELRVNLAILLEYDTDGIRYTEKAHLREAVAEFRELRELDKEYMRSYEDNVLYDLWYLHDHKALLEALTGVPTSDSRKALMLAAVAADQGSDAAIKKSLEITTEQKTASQALTNAGALLIRARRYVEAAELSLAGSHGQANEAQIATAAAIIKKTRPHSEIKMDAADPRSVIERMFLLLFSSSPKFEDVPSIFSKFAMSDPDIEDSAAFRHSMAQLRVQLGSTGLPMETVADIALSNIRFSLEGDESLGYKITIEGPGSQPQEAYVAREDGQWRVVAYAFSSKSIPEAIGWEVLSLLENKDLIHARKWLDWAREKVHIQEGDDTLSGQPFPHFWTKGQEGDEAAIRTAALTLVPSKTLKDDLLSALIHVRDARSSDSERQRLDLVLASAYAAQQRWADLLEEANRLMASAPDSYIAFHFAEQSYAGMKRLDDWDKLVHARLEKHPDDPEYLRSASRLAAWHNDFDKARELMKQLIDHGKASDSDMNSYAWDSLLIRSVPDQDAIDTARRAADLSKNSSWHILHTLACLYAATGKTGQARELLLKTMDLAQMEEPDSEIWFGFGTIAEQYGETDAARVMYSRVEKPKMEYPGTSYTIAQQRLAELKKTVTTEKTNGH